MHPGEKNLNTFRILFLIKGILDLLICLIGIFYMAIGGFAGAAFEEASRQTGESVPFNPGVLFVVIGLIILLFGVALGVPALIASKRISERRSRTFIIVAAAINCLSGVLGILLCIFTIIELQKPEVRELFAQNDA